MSSAPTRILRASRSGERSRLVRGIAAFLLTAVLGVGGAFVAGPLAASAATDGSAPSTGASASPSPTASTAPTPAASASPSPSASASTSPTSAGYVLVLWKGGAGVQWPAGGQTLVTSKATTSSDLNQLNASATECGMTYQVDLYAADATTQKLIDGRVLRGPGNPTESWPGGHYTGAYSKVFTKAACALTLTVSAGPCLAPVNDGGTTAITGTIGNTIVGHHYLATLTPSGRTISVVATATSTPLDFGSRPAGVGYTVSVVDQDNSYLTAKTGVAPVSCPQVGGISLDITPCSTVGGNAVLAITSSNGFVANRTYQVRSGSATGPAVGSPFVATAATTYRVPITPSSTETQLDLVVVDVASGLPIDVEAQSVTVKPCPTPPQVISVTPAPCTVGATSSDVTVSLAGLTTGRTYVPSLDGVLISDKAVTAGGTTATIALSGLAPGDHTIVVTDRDAATVTASATVNVPVCATQPELKVTTTDCTVPVGGGQGGGTGSLGVDLSDLTSGRGYTVAVTSGGKPVAGVGDQTFTATGSTKHVDVTGVPADASYIVTVTDDQDTRATTSAVATMNECPPLPQVGALSVSCTTDGSIATLSLGASDLVPGDRYTVLFERSTAAGGWTAVKQVGPTTSLSSADLSLPGVAVGQTYRVTLTDADNAALTDQLVVPVPDGCSTGQVGGVTYTAGGSVSALALTGTDTGRLALIALLLLIPGAGLIGFAILRHRKEVGD